MGGWDWGSVGWFRRPGQSLSRSGVFNDRLRRSGISPPDLEGSMGCILYSARPFVFRFCRTGGRCGQSLSGSGVFNGRLRRSGTSPPDLEGSTGWNLSSAGPSIFRFCRTGGRRSRFGCSGLLLPPCSSWSPARALKEMGAAKTLTERAAMTRKVRTTL